MTEPGFTGTVLRVFGGPIVWFVHFLTIYSLTALACQRSFATARWLGMEVVPLSTGIATLAALAVLSVLILRALPSLHTDFADAMTVAAGSLAALAIAWETLPVYMVPTCV
jgi:hypothetical protein